MELTQNQIDVLSQNLRKKRIRIELLDFNLKVVDNIEGLAIGGSITANANNDIRRSGTIQMAIPFNASASNFLDQLDGFTVSAGGKIWLDKNIKIYVGIDDLQANDEVVWYKLGVFLINKPTRTFSGDEFSISFECVDLMARLTGLRQGQLTGTTILIEKGYYEKDESGNPIYVKTRLLDALVSTIRDLAGISKYIISPIPPEYEYLPYDIKVGVGSTVYNILKELMNIISTWQMFFDLDGILVISPIPSDKQGIIYPLEEAQYIEDKNSYDFENVKNQIVVYGRLNTLTYYTDNSSGENVSCETNPDGKTATLVLKYSAINTTSLTIAGTTFGFKTLDTYNPLPITNIEIWNKDEKIIYSHDDAVCSLVKFENSNRSFGITYETAQIEAEALPLSEICFIRIYSATLTSQQNVDLTKSIIFEFMGKQQVSYTLVNDNMESPFYINENIDTENYYAGEAKTPLGSELGATFELTLNNVDDINSISNGTQISFMANASNKYSNDNFSKINIKTANGITILENIPLVQNSWDLSGTTPTRPPVAENKLSNDYTVWLLRYENVGSNEWFVLLGRNPNALIKVLSGGEYDNIYADQLAYERCLWELFNTSNMNDNISLSIEPNYLIDVNCKIKYDTASALPQYADKSHSETQYFITKQITYPLGLDATPQSVSAIRIYDSGNLVGEN